MSQILYLAPNEKFTIIPNDLLLDQNLSDGAKVLAFYLMSLPKDWTVVWENVAKALNSTLSTIKRRKQELLKFGFLIPIANRDIKGKFTQNKLAFKYCNNNSLQKLDAEIIVKGSLKTSSAKTHKTDTCDISPVAHLTSCGEMTPYNKTNKDTKKEEKQEIFILQKAELFKTLLEANSKAVENYKKAYDLSTFLDGEELKIAKEWVAWRNAMWRIKPMVSIAKLKKAKESGCDIVQDIKRCMANDWRGYFSHTKDAQTTKTKAQKESTKALHITIYNALKAQGWSLDKGESYKDLRVNGRAVTRENGLFKYA
ncbi:hypothetical protein LS70_003770 [Helicobacter sp. MIT 11-5569]|uniref:hypothetical protein n=1 Tax=Helicobacter sp. MIT 11-5569 TaxID=1548151 RepID=UPI00051FEF8A|nr:hypothetical protein [Helicobacter sp. MIT 11-5569]TLD83936.1 hypothetical protein LS70_003770 [Helicobacter sp. MIT 11-5569]